MLVILAIAAGAAALRYQSSLESAKLEDVADRIEQLDSRGRAYARAGGQALLIGVDLSAGRIWCQDETGRRLPWEVQMPENLRLAQASVASDRSSIGSISIPISRQGLSASYSLCLEDSRGRRRWITVAGLTGQIRHPEHRPDLAGLLGREDRP